MRKGIKGECVAILQTSQGLWCGLNACEGGSWGWTTSWRRCYLRGSAVMNDVRC